MAVTGDPREVRISSAIEAVTLRLALIIIFLSCLALAQMPPVEPGVSHELAKWRATRYSDIRYKINLTLEKMSPVLKGTIEIRVNVGTRTLLSASAQSADIPPIVLDWRKLRGNEILSEVSSVTINGKHAINSPQAAIADKSVRAPFEEHDEHLIFREGVKMGENVIKLDFTSPILTSGSAITRYIDKEDGSEYIYSLFVPSDASTAFPVFDQPDLKAKFSLNITAPKEWNVVSNGYVEREKKDCFQDIPSDTKRDCGPTQELGFAETKPISTYVFAFAAGPFGAIEDDNPFLRLKLVIGTAQSADPLKLKIYVRKSQADKFKPHAAAVFRLNREGIKFLEQYFDYKFPFPKYDLVLIPEFPFGGMEHAGATFLREDRVIFPQEPTKNDFVTRANLIFHEAAHQWFGDTVTMKWFDDLWLKEGFAEFMAYKTLEKVMPEYNAWKVFYERNKQAAYLTDSTKGTTPIYQEIANLNAAKSAYGNIVYRKAPSFLKQAEFYIGPDKFQTAVRAFLKKHEYANAEWMDLVKEFEAASQADLDEWAKLWVMQRGMPEARIERSAADLRKFFGTFAGFPKYSQSFNTTYIGVPDGKGSWVMNAKVLIEHKSRRKTVTDYSVGEKFAIYDDKKIDFNYVFPNFQDYGYGIFLLDDKSRDYILKNIQNEKDDFLRTMMWGSLWDSVREVELDPKEYVELIVKNINVESDESTIQTLLNRVSTAMTYYLSDKQRDEIVPRLEAILIEKMRSAPTLGQRITFYRGFLNIGSTENARNMLKAILKGGNPSGSEGAPKSQGQTGTLPIGRVSALIPLKTKDRFDIVTKLLILGHPDAEALLKELEQKETSDEAKRYAYAAKAGIATAENKAKFWSDFTANKEISESWIEAAFGPFNSPKHADLTLPYLERALKELSNHKRNRKIFFVNGWLAAFIGGQKSEQALAIVNKFLAENPGLDKDLRLKILENVDLIERAVKIRAKYASAARM